MYANCICTIFRVDIVEYLSVMFGKNVKGIL
jgi:hypothetical protein